MTAPADLTPEDLAAIEARCEAATPGPWESLDSQVMRDVRWRRGPIASCLSSYESSQLDAKFIAAARTDIPRLLAALREQSDRVKHYQWEASQLQAERDAARALLARAAELIRDMLVWGTNIDCTTESRKVLAEIEGAEHGKP
jgi:hypothetical protein